MTADAPVDPLAALREPEEAAPTVDTPEPEDELGTILVTQDEQDTARAVVIAAWHADTVALGFLHKGGTCGCHYLAGLAVAAALPVEPVVDEPALEV